MFRVWLDTPSVRVRLVIAFASLWLLKMAQASPQLLRIDGSLYDASGLPVSGQRDLQLKVYDAPSGGTLLWTSPVYLVNSTNGHFSLNLDASTGSPSLVQRLSESSSSAPVWFEIHYDSGAAGNGSLNTDLTVRPRIRARGTTFALSAASADALKGVTAVAAELNFLAGSTANIQAQLNAKATGSSYVAKIGDTMSGGLGLAYTGVTLNTVAIVDSSRKLVSSAVTSAELGYLSGVTLALGSNLNGITQNVQTQLNARATATGLTSVSNAVAGLSTWIGAKADAANALLKGGDTMSGDLGLGGSQITATGKVLTLDSSRRVSTSPVSSTELGYLAGVTASLAPIVNALEGVTGLVLDSYLGGLTANIQTQLNAKASGTNFVAKTGDTMSGPLVITSGQLSSAISDTSSFTCGSTSLDFNTGNFQSLSASVPIGACTINLANMRDGGSYTVIVKGSAATNSVTYSFSHSGVSNWRFVPVISPTIAGMETVFTLVKAGTTVYVSWIPGF